MTSEINNIKKIGGIILILGGAYQLGTHFFPATQRSTKVEPGYASPSDLEIKLVDTNKNGIPETTLIYQDHNYKILTTADGKLTLAPYSP